MVSNMSVTNLRSSSSKLATGVVGSCSTGSPAITMGWIVTSSSCQRGIGVSRGLAGSCCRGDHQAAWSNMIYGDDGRVVHREDDRVLRGERWTLRSRLPDRLP